MSTSYRFLGKVSEIDFWKAVDRCGLKLYVSDSRAKAVTDGDSYLWPEFEGGNLLDVTRYGANDPSGILQLLADALGFEYLSEHDDGFFDEED